MLRMRCKIPMKRSALFKRWTILLLVVAGLFLAILPRFVGREAEDLNRAAESQDILPDMDAVLPAEVKVNPDFSIGGKATAKERPSVVDKPGGLFGSTEKSN